MRIKKCGRCKFWCGRTRCVGGTGNTKSGVVILTESPGKLEVHPDLEHEVLIAEAGAIMNYGLRRAGLFKDSSDRGEYAYFTNAVKCYPSSNKRELIPEKISQEHKKKCQFWFRKEMERVKPKYVFVVGTHALQSFTGNYSLSIEKERSFWKWSEKWNCWYLPTVHPAAILRNWGLTSPFFRDCEKFVHGIRNGVKIRTLGKKYKTIKRMGEVKSLIKKLSTKKRVAWDLETTTLRFWDTTKKKTGNFDDVLGVSFSWGLGRAAYIPFHYLETETENKKTLYNEELKCYWTKKEMVQIYKLINKVLSNPKIKKDGQNTKFDINWMRAKGITVEGVDWDTMQFHHLIDENTPANLTYLTAYYDLRFPKYDDEIKPYLHNRGRLKEKCYGWIPLDILSKYACADVDAVFRISRKQRKIASPRQKNLYYNYSVPMSKFAADMEYTGVLIDVDRISEMEKKYEKKINRENQKLCKLVKRENFNVASPQQMVSLLFDSKKDGGLGIKVYKRTPKGNISTDADVFNFIKRDYKSKKILRVLDLVENVRKMRKMKSTYLTGFKRLVDKNNRVHTSYLTTGTVTGRLASEGPNLQNIPRDEIFRSLFISGPGRKFTAADYDQVEYRMMAWLALQFDLIDKFKDPKFDIHYHNSATVRGIPYEEVTKEQRSYDKAVTFGMNYGRSNRTIAEEYDRSIEEVDDFVNKYFQENPKIARYRKKNAKLARKQHYLETRTGRRRHFTAFEWIDSKEMRAVDERRDYVGERSWIVQSIIGNMERQAINFPVQSYSSDCLTAATDRVRKALKAKGIDSNLVLTVHDMIGLDTAESDVKKMHKVLESMMPFKERKTNKKTGKKITIKFTIDYDTKDCWVQ